LRRFVFELDGVLKYKQSRELLADIQHKQAAAALQIAQVEVAALGDQLNQACARLQEKLGKAQDTTNWLAVYRQSTLLEQALQTATRQVERAAHECDRAAAARKQAAVEVEVLLTLRQRKWLDYRKKTQQAVQDQLDELGLRRWQAARADTSGESDPEGASA
jgi:flagellar export protein FliJ